MIFFLPNRAVMMAESVSSLMVLIFQWIAHRIKIYRSTDGDAYIDQEEDPGTPILTPLPFPSVCFIPFRSFPYLSVPIRRNSWVATPDEQVPRWWWMSGLVVASFLAVICSWAIFKDRMPFYQPLVGNKFSPSPIWRQYNIFLPPLF
jgi:hypothetical protein